MYSVYMQHANYCYIKHVTSVPTVHFSIVRTNFNIFDLAFFD